MRVLPRAEAALRAGHPWVFAESVKEQNREGEAGELAVVYDRRDRFLAVGLYDPASPIRLRVVQADEPATIDGAWWLEKARAAKARRAGLFGGGTDGLRWINGDSEGFPGLVVDGYGGTLVAKLYSPVWLRRWEEIEGVLREVFAPRFFMLRLSRNLEAEAAAAGLVEGWRGDEGAETVVFRENGLSFEAEVRRGQKTGFFLDQRDNRARVEALAAGREVLNVFSFSGAFSLYAARGGATAVTDLDLSAHALESGDRNFALNLDHPRIAAVRREAVQADAFRWLAETERKFDLIVVDPPSLAKREKEREGALTAYRKLNADALRRLRPGGVLVAASCSAHVAREEFFSMIRRVAARTGRPWRELWTSSHAADHPATFPEAKYLKALALEIA